jgi:hypothetical protein
MSYVTTPAPAFANIIPLQKASHPNVSGPFPFTPNIPGSLLAHCLTFGSADTQSQAPPSHPRSYMSPAQSARPPSARAPTTSSPSAPAAGPTHTELCESPAVSPHPAAPAPPTSNLSRGDTRSTQTPTPTQRIVIRNPQSPIITARRFTESLFPVGVARGGRSIGMFPHKRLCWPFPQFQAKVEKMISSLNPSPACQSTLARYILRQEKKCPVISTGRLTNTMSVIYRPKLEVDT